METRDGGTGEGECRDTAPVGKQPSPSQPVPAAAAPFAKCPLSTNPPRQLSACTPFTRSSPDPK